MLHKVDFTLSVWRWLFQPLYERVEAMALASGDSVESAKARLASLLINDPKHILLVDLDEANPQRIKAHCLISLNILEDKTIQVFYEQLKDDTGHNTNFAKACIAYAENVIAKDYPVSELAMLTDESKYKAFKKKYEFTVRKVFMVREVKRESSVEP